MLIDTLGPAIVNSKDSKNRHVWYYKININSSLNRIVKHLILGTSVRKWRFISLNKYWALLWCCTCRTPLHAAAFTDHVECLQLLLSHNAQVNSVDAVGKTPLMMAAENGQTNAVGTKALTISLANITTGHNNQVEDWINKLCFIELTSFCFSCVWSCHH